MFFWASMFFPSGKQDSPWAWWVLLVEVRGISGRVCYVTQGILLVLFVYLHFGLIFIFTINVGRLNDFYGKCR